MRLTEIIHLYTDRQIKATCFFGIDPREATNYFRDNSKEATVSFNNDELFNELIYKEDVKINNNNFWISPCSYSNNKRKKDNFKSMSFLVLDYDDGYSIADLQKNLDAVELSYIIYTTKSHQQDKITKSGDTKKACDRFRCFIPLSKDIETSQALYQFMQVVKNIEPFSYADKACFESSRMYHMNPDCDTFISKNKYCLDAEKLIEAGKSYLKRFTAGNSKNYDDKDVEQLVFDITNTKLNKYLRRSMQQYHDNTEWKSENTYSKIFGSVCHAFTKKSDWNIVYQALINWEVYKDWISRKPYQKATTKQMVSKCYFTVFENELKAKNPVNEIDIKDLSIDIDFARNGLELRKSRKMLNEISNTDMLLDYCMKSDDKRIILQSPCGGGKSTASIAYIATNANNENPIWLISETRLLCLANKQELEQVYNIDVGYLSGFDLKRCSKAVIDSNGSYYIDDMKSMREAYNRSFCSGCSDIKTCYFYQSRNKEKEILSKSAIVMTHKKLITLFQQNKIPDNVTIIIDEELKRWENLSFIENDLFELRNIVKDVHLWNDQTLIIEYQDFIFALEKLMNECKNNSGVECCDISLSKDLKYQLFKILCKNEISSSLDTDTFDQLNEFVNFFSNQSTKYMRFQKGDCFNSYDCGTDTINFNIPNKTIILNASANYSHVTWEDFVIYKIKESLSFQNTTFHCILANPTKRRIMTGGKNQKPLIDTIIKKAENIITINNINDIFIARDKSINNPTLKKFTDKMTKQKKNVATIARGNIQSNNTARCAPEQR